MIRYLISFDDGAMDALTEEELAAASRDSHAVVEAAKKAGVWIFGAGLERRRAAIVDTDGTVSEGPFPETKAVLGGFSVIEVKAHEDALSWAAKIAAACRCAQEVRVLYYDPES